MKLLLWLRALRAWNFYNWNSSVGMKEYSLVLEDMIDLEDFNVGLEIQVTSGQSHHRQNYGEVEV